nr:hypothetical protein [uncultured Actinoplanes sp.]
MSWIRARRQVLITVLGALVGAILGAAVQELLDTKYRLITGILVVLSLATLSLLASLSAIVTTVEEGIEKTLRESRSAAAAHEEKLARTEAGLRLSAEQTTKAIEVLTDHFGFRVQRLLLSDVNSLRSLEEDETAKLILSAKREICILDLISDDGHWPDESINDGHSRKYFDALAKKIEGSGTNLSYKRVVQVREPRSTLPRVRSVICAEHYTRMLDLRDTREHRISIRVARQRFPFTLVIIDDSLLIIQLAEFNAGSSSLKIWCDLLITDPNKKLINLFLMFWEQIYEDEHTRALSHDDFPAP